MDSSKNVNLEYYENKILNEKYTSKENSGFEDLWNAKTQAQVKDKKTLIDVKPNNLIEPVSFFGIFKYSTPSNRLLYFLGILAAFATGLTTPANSLIFGNLANSMILSDNDGLIQAVQTFAFQNTLIGIVMLVCSYISVTTFNYAAHAQILRIRGQYFRSALHQDISWFDLNQSGEVASRMNEDLSKMEDGLGEKVVMFVHFITAFLGSIILAFIKGWQLALVCLSSLPVTFIAMGFVGIATSKLAKRESDVYAKAGNIAEEAISGIRTVKAFEGEEKELNAYLSKIVDAKELNIKKNMFSGIGFGLLWFFIYASYALAFWYGVGLVIKNYKGIQNYSNYNPGTMITVFFSIMMGSMNIGMASPYIESFGVAKGACAKVFQIIEQVPKINPIIKVGKNLNEPLEHITFKDVEFHYPTRKDVKVLNKFSLKIQRGETIALVGASGCGKSTCLQLIQRFYDPDNGNILFNGVDLKDININWLRARIGVVSQEPILFSTSIYENIRYGREDASKEEIEKAAAAANAENFIKNLPKGYDTLVGERGIQLSGGQKQRIAIARALIRNPEILLLDEATSALDTASEHKVQEALEKAFEDRTTIIIAHRLSTIKRADRIIVINNGAVVERGNHQKLMALKGHYYNLVIKQVGENDFETAPKPHYPEKPIISQSDDEILNYKNDEQEALDTRSHKIKNSSLLAILRMNKPEWFQITCGCLCSVVMGCAMPLFAILFGEILQVLSNNGDPDAIRENTNKYSLYFLFCGIVVGLATFLQIYTFGIAGEKLTERLRGLMFKAILRQDVAWFDDDSNGTGSLCARLSGDSSAVQGATGQRIGTIVQSLTTIILGVGLSMYYEWSLGLLALAFCPFILIATFLQRKVMSQENMGTTKAMRICTKLAIEIVSNIRTVASLGREEMFYNQYMEKLYPAIGTAKRNTHFRGFVYGLARSLMFFAYAACMYYGGYCIVNKGMEFGNVFKVSQALIMGTASIASALAFAPNFQKGLAAAENIFSLLQRQPEVSDKDGANLHNWQCEGSVNYEKVSFNYPTRKEVNVLKDLSLCVNSGKKVALVGPSGCGKSTCIQLILRFYDVQEGCIRIDSYNVGNILISNLRSQLGIVSQEPILFDRSIRDNIAYGDNKRIISEQDIIAASKKANIHNFISSLPLGYQTRLGEKGTQLSGGQKQRIAIARALVRNPKILLLDEATSALDAESEKIVQEALDAASEGRTTITIAHRLSTVIDYDTIFVFETGKLLEFGTHQELLKKRGLYYMLYKLQN